MKKKGFTLVELVIVLVIVSLTAGTFEGLIREMTESSTLIMGKKESHQQAKEALKKMAEELQYNIKGGIYHNFGVVTLNTWQNNPTDYCTDSRISFFPGSFTFNSRINATFKWQNSGAIPAPSAALSGIPACAAPATPPPPGYLMVRYETRYNPGSGANESCATTLFGGVLDATKGTLEVRYYDAGGTQLAVGGGLTHAQAQTVSKVVLLLTVNKWGKAVTLSETVFVRRKGTPPPEEEAA